MRKARKLLSVVLALVLAASMLPAALATGEETTQITILGTSDMHSDIWGFDYANVEETEGTGMARLYTYIQQVREENPNTILVDGGDDIQGTIMSDDIFNKNPDRDHPVVAAMNFMGYDAMTLGNHEFNWGIKDMQAIMGQAEFPVLCANVTDKDGELVTGEGWTIVEKGGVKLAIIGVTSPSVPRWDGGKEGIDDCTYEDASEAVRRPSRRLAIRPTSSWFPPTWAWRPSTISTRMIAGTPLRRSWRSIPRWTCSRWPTPTPPSMRRSARFPWPVCAAAAWRSPASI